jgi:hypothetical protein
MTPRRPPIEQVLARPEPTDNFFVRDARALRSGLGSMRKLYSASFFIQLHSTSACVAEIVHVFSANHLALRVITIVIRQCGRE